MASLNAVAASLRGNRPLVGTVVSVPFVEEAGLQQRTQIPFFVRAEHATLWDKLDRTSCLLVGLPGSGQSTAVWFWLLWRVANTGRPAVWLHFNKFGTHSLVHIQLVHGQLVLQRIIERNPFDRDLFSLNIDTCVVDGITNENKGKAGKSWQAVFGLDSFVYKDRHMIWVSSQQVLIAGEHLEMYNVERHLHFSWSETEIARYTAMFPPDEKRAFILDVVSGTPAGRLMPSEEPSFEQALEIRMWYCGCSARWIFGMTMTAAINDIKNHVAAVGNAEAVQFGLSGSRSTVAVNCESSRFNV